MEVLPGRPLLQISFVGRYAIWFLSISRFFSDLHRALLFNPAPVSLDAAAGDKLLFLHVLEGGVRFDPSGLHPAKLQPRPQDVFLSG